MAMARRMVRSRPPTAMSGSSGATTVRQGPHCCWRSRPAPDLSGRRSRTVRLRSGRCWQFRTGLLRLHRERRRQTGVDRHGRQNTHAHRAGAQELDPCGTQRLRCRLRLWRHGNCSIAGEGENRGLARSD
jgi:hypothetical protein